MLQLSKFYIELHAPGTSRNMSALEKEERVRLHDDHFLFSHNLFLFTFVLLTRDTFLYGYVGTNSLQF